MPAPQAMRSRIVALVEPVVRACGYDLEEVAVNQAGRRTVVRVVVDADGGVTLDDIAEVSREVSTALDADDSAFGAGPYTLEVTSPGVDRPLTQPRHWRRNVGRLVNVRLGDQNLTARVTAADENGVELTDAKGARTASYGELGPGKVEVEFSRPTEKADKAEKATTEGGDR